jgi:hypothetical protein
MSDPLASCATTLSEKLGLDPTAARNRVDELYLELDRNLSPDYKGRARAQAITTQLRERVEREVSATAPAPANGHGEPVERWLRHDKEEWDALIEQAVEEAFEGEQFPTVRSIVGTVSQRTGLCVEFCRVKMDLFVAGHREYRVLTRPVLVRVGRRERP